MCAFLSYRVMSLLTLNQCLHRVQISHLGLSPEYSIYHTFLGKLWIRVAISELGPAFVSRVPVCPMQTSKLLTRYEVHQNRWRQSLCWVYSSIQQTTFLVTVKAKRQMCWYTYSPFGVTDRSPLIVWICGRSDCMNIAERILSVRESETIFQVWDF